MKPQKKLVDLIDRLVRDDGPGRGVVEDVVVLVVLPEPYDNKVIKTLRYKPCCDCYGSKE